MTAPIAGVALAAGAGTRLAPITDAIPKPLCEVATETLLDSALARLRTIGAELAVNVHHHANQIVEHLDEEIHVSHESAQALGTAGALGQLREWIDGRPTAVVNADTWCPSGLEALVAGWDGRSVRVMVPGGGHFGPRSGVVATALPWWVVERLEATPSGLYEVVWSTEAVAPMLQVVGFDGQWVDCGTPNDLHAANMAALGEGNVVHAEAVLAGSASRSAVSAGAAVYGRAVESVLLPGAVVQAGELLTRAIRWLSADGQQTLHL